jgi:hypothetical protein
MSIVLGSWADFGYRKVGPLPATGGGLSPAQVAQERMLRGDYEATADHWVRRRARRKNCPLPECIQIIDVLDKDVTLDDGRLAFIDECFRSKWFNVGAPEFMADEYQTLLSLVEAAATSEERWSGMYRLTQALFYAGRGRLRPLFRQHIVPCFFKLYPQGKIIVLRYGTGVDEAAAMLRTLYALAQASLADLNQGGFEGVQTLRNWHFTSLTKLFPVLLDFFNFLFYPYVGGFHGGPPGLNFLFLFEPAEQYRPMPFPRNWLGVPNASAGFGNEGIDPLEVVVDFPGPAYQRAGHQRYQHPQGFTVDERLALLRWYIGRVNRFLYELTDAANFTEGHDVRAPINPVFGFEHLLTTDRLLRKTLLSMSLDEAHAAKLMVFEIADLYDGLSDRFRNHKNKTEFFKSLFHTTNGPGLVGPRLDTLPAPFGGYLCAVAGQVYRKIEDVVLASVWVKAKRTPRGILVRSNDLTSEEEMAPPEFVAEVMRAYRNAHHGYFSADPSSRNRPTRFLFPVDGNLPMEMSALPVLWWLAYLADPGIVGWRHLPINAFD